MRRGRLSLKSKKSQPVDSLKPSKVTLPLAADPVQPGSSIPLGVGADLDLGTVFQTVTPEIAAFPARMMSQEDSYDRRNSLYPIQAPEELAAAISAVDLTHTVPVEAARFLDLDKVIFKKDNKAIETMLTSIAADQHPLTETRPEHLKALTTLERLRVLLSLEVGAREKAFSIAQLTTILVKGSAYQNLAALIDSLEPAWHDPSKRKLEMLLEAGFTIEWIIKILAHDGGGLTLEALLNLFVPADNGSGTPLEWLKNFKFEVKDIVSILSKKGGSVALEALIQLMPKVPAHCLTEECIASIAALAKKEGRSYYLKYLLGILTNDDLIEFYDTPEKFCSICNALRNYLLGIAELNQYATPRDFLEKKCLLKQQKNTSKREIGQMKSAHQSKRAQAVTTSMLPETTEMNPAQPQEELAAATSIVDLSHISTMPAVPVEAALFPDLDNAIVNKDEKAIETMLTSIAEDQHSSTGETHADLKRLLSLGGERAFSIAQLTTILVKGSGYQNLAALINLLEPAQHDPSKCKLEMLLEAGFTIEQIINILAHNGVRLTLAALLGLFVPADNGSGTPLEWLKNFKFEVKDIVSILSKKGGSVALKALIQLMPEVPAHCLAKKCIASIAALAKKERRSYHLKYLLGILTNDDLIEFYDTPEKFCSICDVLKRRGLTAQNLMDDYSDPQALLKENCPLEQQKNTRKRKSARKSKSAKAVATSMPPASTFTPETDEDFLARMMTEIDSTQFPAESGAATSIADSAHISTVPVEAALFLNIYETIVNKDEKAIETMLTSIAKDQHPPTGETHADLKRLLSLGGERAFSIAQLTTILVKGSGYQNLAALIDLLEPAQHDPSKCKLEMLLEAGFTIEQIIKILAHYGGSLTLGALLGLFALTTHDSSKRKLEMLLEAGFTIEQIVKILAHDGGRLALGALLGLFALTTHDPSKRKLEMLLEAGFTIEQIVKILAHNSGSLTLEALLGLFAPAENGSGTPLEWLKNFKFEVEDIVSILSRFSGALTLKSLIELMGNVPPHCLTAECIASIGAIAKANAHSQHLTYLSEILTDKNLTEFYDTPEKFCFICDVLKRRGLTVAKLSNYSTPQNFLTENCPLEQQRNTRKRKSARKSKSAKAVATSMPPASTFTPETDEDFLARMMTEIDSTQFPAESGAATSIADSAHISTVPAVPIEAALFPDLDNAIVNKDEKAIETMLTSIAEDQHPPTGETHADLKRLLSFFSIAQLTTILVKGSGYQNLAALIDLLEPAQHDPSKCKLEMLLEAGFTIEQIIKILAYDGGGLALGALLGLFALTTHDLSKRKLDMLLEAGFTIEWIIKILAHNSGSLTLEALLNLFAPADNGSGTPLELLKNFKFEVKDIVSILSKNGGSVALKALIELMPKVPAHCLAKKCIASIAAIAKTKAHSQHLTYLLGILTSKDLTKFYDTPEKFCSICDVLKRRELTAEKLMDDSLDQGAFLKENCPLEQQRNTRKRKIGRMKSAKAVATSMPPASTFTPEIDEDFLARMMTEIDSTQFPAESGAATSIADSAHISTVPVEAALFPDLDNAIVNKDEEAIETMLTSLAKDQHPPTGEMHADLKRLLSLGGERAFSIAQLTTILVKGSGYQNLVALIDLLEPAQHDPSKSKLEMLLEAGFTIEQIVKILAHDGGRLALGALLGLFAPTTHDPSKRKLERLLEAGFTIEQIINILAHNGGSLALGALLGLFAPTTHDPSKRKLEMLLEAGFTIEWIIKILAHDGGSLTLEALLNLFVPADNGSGTPLELLKNFKFEVKDIVSILSKKGGSFALKALIELMPEVPLHCLTAECIASIAAIAKTNAHSQHLTYLLGILTNKNLTEFYDTSEKFCSICDVLKRRELTAEKLMDDSLDQGAFLKENCPLEQQRNTRKRKIGRMKSAKAVATSMPPASTFTPETDEDFLARMMTEIDSTQFPAESGAATSIADSAHISTVPAVPIEAALFPDLDNAIVNKDEKAIETMLTSIAKDQHPPTGEMHADLKRLLSLGGERAFSIAQLTTILVKGSGYQNLVALIDLLEPAQHDPSKCKLEMLLEAGFTIEQIINILAHKGGSLALGALLGLFALTTHDPSKRKLEMLLEAGFTIEQIVKILAHDGGGLTLEALLGLFVPADNGSGTPLEWLKNLNFKVEHIVKILSEQGGSVALEALIQLMPEVPLHCLTAECIASIAAIAKTKAHSQHLTYLSEILTSKDLTKFYDTPEKFCFICDVLKGRELTVKKLSNYSTPQNFLAENCPLEQQKNTRKRKSARKSKSAKAVAISMPPASTFTPETDEDFLACMMTEIDSTQFPTESGAATSIADPAHISTVPVEAALSLNIYETIVSKDEKAIETMLTSIAEDQHPPTGETHADLKRLLSLGGERAFSIAQLTTILVKGSGYQNLAALINLLEPAQHDPSKCKLEMLLEAGFTIEQIIKILAYDGGGLALGALLGLFALTTHDLSKRKLEMLLEAGFTIEQIIEVLAHDGGKHTLAALLGLFAPADNDSGTSLNSLLVEFRFKVQDIVGILSKCGGARILKLLVQLMPKVPLHCLTAECIASLAALAKKEGRSYHLNYLLGILTDKKLTEFYDTPEKLCSICDALQQPRITVKNLRAYPTPQNFLAENCPLEQQKNTSKRKSARKSKSAKAVATSMPPALTFTPETDEDFLARMMTEIDSTQFPAESGAATSIADSAHISTVPVEAALFPDLDNAIVNKDEKAIETMLTSLAKDQHPPTGETHADLKRLLSLGGERAFSIAQLTTILVKGSGYQNLAALIDLLEPAQHDPSKCKLEMLLEAGFTIEQIINILAHKGGSLALGALLGLFALTTHDPSKRKLEMLLEAGFTIEQIVKILAHDGGGLTLEALLNLFVPADNGSDTPLEWLKNLNFKVEHIVKILSEQGGSVALEALIQLMPEVPLHCLAKECIESIAAIAKTKAHSQHLTYLSEILTSKDLTEFYDTPEKFRSICDVLKGRELTVEKLSNYSNPRNFLVENCPLEQQKNTSKRKSARKSKSAKAVATSMPPASTFTPETDEDFLARMMTEIDSTQFPAELGAATSIADSAHISTVPVEAALFPDLDNAIVNKDEKAIETMLTSLAKDQHPPTEEMHADLKRLLSLGGERAFSIAQLTTILVKGSGYQNLVALIDLLEPAQHDPSKSKLEMLLEAGFTIEQIIDILAHNGGSLALGALLGLFAPTTHDLSKRKLEMLLEAGFTIEWIIKILAHDGGGLTLEALLNLFVPAENGSGTPLELLQNFKFEVKDIVSILSKCCGARILKLLVQLMPKVPAHCLTEECIASIAALAKKEGRSYHLNYLLGILTDKKLTEFYDTPEKLCSICNVLKRRGLTVEKLSNYSNPRNFLEENCPLEQQKNTRKRKSGRMKSAKAVTTSMPPASTFTPETDESFVARMMNQLYSYNGSSLQPPEELSAIISTVDLAHIATAPEDAAAQQTRKRKRNDEQEQEQERPRSRRRKKASAASAISASAQLPLTPSEGLLPYLEATTSVIPDISDLSPLISSENFNLENSTGFLNFGSAISAEPIAAQSTVDAVDVTVESRATAVDVPVESIAAVVDVDVDVTVESRAAAQQTRKRKRDDECEPAPPKRRKRASASPLLCQSTLFGCNLSSLPVERQSLAGDPMEDWFSKAIGGNIEDNAAEFAKKFP